MNSLVYKSVFRYFLKIISFFLSFVFFNYIIADDGSLWTETCSILSLITVTINVMHVGYILCLIDNIRAQRHEPIKIHQFSEL